MTCEDAARDGRGDTHRGGHGRGRGRSDWHRRGGRLQDSAGERAGPTRSGRLHDPDRQPLLAAEARQPLGLSRDRPGGDEAESRGHGHSKTKKIANGITARVVHDVVTEDGKPVEVTDDWYAQDTCGNIWYLGEATKEFENGKVVSTEGSFEAGVDGAQPGIVMPAKPRAGMRYRQEYYAGHAEDRAEVLSVREQVEVPFGFFGKGRVVMTRDLNPLEPKVLEYKFYARGVGPVLAVGVSGGSDREELVSYSKGK